MTWGIFQKQDPKSRTKEIVREEMEDLPEGYTFLMEATEADVDAELERRKKTMGSSV